MKHKAYAFVRPDGSFQIESGHTEKGAWLRNLSDYAVGYASLEMHMEAGKAKGYRVVQVEVEIPE